MSATPRPWKLVQYSTGLYIVDATGRTMAVAAVDRADQGEAVEEIRTSLAVAVHAVNTFDEAKAALEQSNAILLWYLLHYGNAGAAEYRVSENKAVLAKLEGA